MVCTIITEARTGGSHLVEAINEALPNYVLTAEPWNGAPNNFSDVNDVTNVDWIDNYENIIIKEIYDPNVNFLPLIHKSDKVFCLYKENWYSQIKSMLYSRNFDEWQWEYKKSDVDNVVTEKEIYQTYYSNFKWYKIEFQTFIKNHNLQSTSYEKLYFGDGVTQIQKFFELGHGFKFPIYDRHLKDDNGNAIGFETPPKEPTDLKYLNNLMDLSDRTKTDIMFNFLMEQQELNNKILKELDELKNRK
jgi:hypothetical protein